MAKIIDNYILIESIGQGAFGEIHKGRNLISKEAVAVKTIKLDRFLNDTLLRDMIINEIQALKKLEHQYICRMIKMLKSSNNIYLVYEYLNGGSLQKILNEKQHLSESEAKPILFGVFKQTPKNYLFSIRGFKVLYNEKIIHRNINPKNLYFNDSIVKVKNFFCCKSPISSKNFDCQNYLYAAPEILLKQQQPQHETKCDIFSIGLIYFKMLFGQLPFQENIAQEELCEFYINSSQDGFKADQISDFSNNLLDGMLKFDQSKRIDWETIFNMVQDEQNGQSYYPSNQHTSSSNFETLGQNFYVSQQSSNNCNRIDFIQLLDLPLQQQTGFSTNNSSSNDIMKRRTTMSQADKSNLTNKENGSDKDELRESRKDKTFAKTMEKELMTTSQNRVNSNSILDQRNKLSIVIGGIQKYFELESWIAKIKPEICLMVLIKKGIKRCQEFLQHLESSNEYERQHPKWHNSRQKGEMIRMTKKDLDDLIRQFEKLKEYEQDSQEEFQQYEMIDENYIDNLLLMISKQISLECNQQHRSSFKGGSQLRNNDTANMSQVKFGIYLIDLVKHQYGNDDGVQQKYFRRLEEQNRDKLLEQLDSKLRLLI